MGSGHGSFVNCAKTCGVDEQTGENVHVASFKRPPIVTAFVLGMYKNMAASFSMGHCELVEGELVAAAAHARAQPAMAHSTARTSPMYVCMLSSSRLVRAGELRRRVWVSTGL